jgi:phosphoglycolate phosphatase-like HAD superfamily hydrolase
MSPRLARLRGVLLDVDGTLLDSNGAHASAWADVLTDAGYNIRPEHVRPLIGMGGDKVVPILTGFDHESPQGKRFSERKKVVFDQKYLPHLRPTSGARQLLEQMLREGLTLIIATSAGGDELRGLLDRAGIADLVHDATSSGDVDSSKPDPDVIGAGLRKGGLTADEVVMVGDTPYDIAAAARIGVPTIALRCGGWWDDLALGGAVAIYDNPADLLARYDESPLSDVELGGWRVEDGVFRPSPPRGTVHPRP